MKGRRPLESLKCALAKPRHASSSTAHLGRTMTIAQLTFATRDAQNLRVKGKPYDMDDV